MKMSMVMAMTLTVIVAAVVVIVMVIVAVVEVGAAVARSIQKVEGRVGVVVGMITGIDATPRLGYGWAWQGLDGEVV